MAPFDWDLGAVERYPVPVDAIPDIGENQQIVFTKWEGRSPRDVEDQITFPLTTSLLGIPGNDVPIDWNTVIFNGLTIWYAWNWVM